MILFMLLNKLRILTIESKNGNKKRRMAISADEDQSRFDLGVPVVEDSQVQRDLEESSHQVVVEAEVPWEKISEEDLGKETT